VHPIFCPNELFAASTISINGWYVYHEYLESSKMWRWRRMEEIIWADRVRIEVLKTVKGDGISYKQQTKKG
jgi:hypothetical protein